MHVSPADVSLANILSSRSRETPDRRAYTFLRNGEEAAEHLTYREVHSDATRIAAALAAAAKCGDRVLLLFPPGLGFVRGYFACLYAGMIAVPLPPAHAYMTAARIAPKMRSIVVNSGPALVLTETSLLSWISRLQEHVPELAGVTWIAEDDARRAISDTAANQPRRHTDLALLQYSSGSTATPKGIMLSHANVRANSLALREAFGAIDGSVIANWLPHDHDMGFISAFIQPIFGSHLVFMSPLHFAQRPIRWLQAISAYRAAMAGAPNFALELSCNRTSESERRSLDLSCLRLLFTGAEPVSAKTLRRFSEAFEPAGLRRDAVLPGYGLAEATMLVTLAPLDEMPITIRADRQALDRGRVLAAEDDNVQAREVVGCGVPIRDLEVIIVGEGRRRVADNEIGEIWIRGPSVAQGYWNREQDSEATFYGRLAEAEKAEPYLRTGDVGFIRAGQVFLVGRMKDTIILGGLNYHAEDIEQTVQSACPSEIGGSVAFSDIGETSEKLIVIVETARGVSSEAFPEMANAMRVAVLAAHGISVDTLSIVTPSGIPRTFNRKLQRSRARDMFRDGAFNVLAMFAQGQPDFKSR